MNFWCMFTIFSVLKQRFYCLNMDRKDNVNILAGFSLVSVALISSRCQTNTPALGSPLYPEPTVARPGRRGCWRRRSPAPCADRWGSGRVSFRRELQTFRLSCGFSSLDRTDSFLDKLLSVHALRDDWQGVWRIRAQCSYHVCWGMFWFLQPTWRREHQILFDTSHFLLFLPLNKRYQKFLWRNYWSEFPACLLSIRAK